MTTLLAQTEPVLLLSVYKPLVMAAALWAWARVTIFFNQDLHRYSGPAQFWNSIQVGAGIAGFGLWLILPHFWIGLLVATGTVGSAAIGYVLYRNQRVPTAAMWTVRSTATAPRKSPIRDWHRHRVNAVFIDQHGHTLKVPTGHTASSRAHHLFEELIGFALARRVEEVHMVLSGQGASVKVCIDGIDYPQPGLGRDAVAGLIDYLKHTGGMDVSDKRRKMTSKLRVKTQQAGLHTVALTTSGSMRGLELSIQVDKETVTQRDLDQLGLLPSQTAQLRAVLDQQHRAVIVACPPGQGQTTTLYSLLQQHDPYIENIITLENHIPFEIEGVNHHLIRLGTPAKQVDQILLSLLRQDPQVFMLNDLTETGTTGPTVAKAANEIRLYLGTRHTDTFAALKDWLRWVKDPQIAADALGAIIAGHTLRVLCTHCRRPYTPRSSLLKKLNLSAQRVQTLYKDAAQPEQWLTASAPCSHCWGLGYAGRVGVYEVMAFDDEARRFVAEQQPDRLRTHLRKNKMLWLQEAALAKAIEGTTSIEEIARVLDPHTVKTEH